MYEVEDEFMRKKMAIKLITLESHEALQSLFFEYDSRKKIKNVEHILLGDQPIKIDYHGDQVVVYPMELADKSFRDWLNEPYDNFEERLETGIEFIKQACKGIAALHDVDLIHLDIKPENILMLKEGRGKEDIWKVKITDFGLTRGIGKMAGMLGDSSEGVGTPIYMSPEQILAAHWKDVGKESDIYAVGTMLYELLMNRTPYSGTPQTVKQKKLNRDIQITEPEGPQELIYLVMNCLERERKKRLGSIKEIVEKINFDWKSRETQVDEHQNSETGNDRKSEYKSDLSQAVNWLEKFVSRIDSELISRLNQIEKEL